MANPTTAVPRYTVEWGDCKRYWPLDDAVGTYYPNEMIGVNAAGYATKLDDTAALTFVGLNASSARLEIVTADTDGSVEIEAEQPFRFSMKIAATLSIADIGRPLYALYSDEVSFSPGTYANYVGVCAGFNSTTEVLIAPPWAPLASHTGLVPGSTSLVASHVYNAPADLAFFVADRAYKVKSIKVRPRVVGSDAGAVTAEVRKAASGTAPSAGTILHTGTANLKATVDTDQTLTLTATAADLLLAAGDALCLDPTGTTTAATGVVSVALEAV